MTICEKTLYNYINSRLFLNINKSHLPYNKKNKLTKPKERSIRKKGGRSIEDWMNNYPRKLFNGKSSNEIYEKSKKYIS